MLFDPGVEDVMLTVKTDATAAVGIESRRGVGKVRHIETNQLWLQDKVTKKEIKVVKVSTHQNLADHMTKPGTKESISKHMSATCQSYGAGRHQLMPGRAE